MENAETLSVLDAFFNGRYWIESEKSSGALDILSIILARTVGFVLPADCMPVRASTKFYVTVKRAAQFIAQVKNIKVECKRCPIPV